MKIHRHVRKVSKITLHLALYLLVGVGGYTLSRAAFNPCPKGCYCKCKCGCQKTGECHCIDTVGK